MNIGDVIGRVSFAAQSPRPLIQVLWIDGPANCEPVPVCVVRCAMPTIESAKLYGHWLALWNGDFTFAEEVVASDCVIHHPSLADDPSDSRSGAERIAAMVREGRAPFQKLIFTLEVGPIEEDGLLAARWTGRGNYSGGMPHATASAGATVEFSGIDLLRLREGKVAEYWVSSDTLSLLQQLGALPSPVESKAGTGD